MHRSDPILKRLEALHPKVIDLSLDRVHRLLEAVGNPHRKLPPVIHVAGTNGKGSVCAFISNILATAGYTVDQFTSPHLQKFHERIRLAGRPIEEDALVALLERVETANDSAAITFFEITTVAAFLAFAESGADFVVLETGLGGRLDATNVVDRPALTVITPVSYDHQSFLGQTLREIAGEKAGILKSGTVGIIGPQEGEALSVIENRAVRTGVTLKVYGQDWDAYHEQGRLVYQNDAELIDLPVPGLRGPHQFANAGTAVAAIRHLPGATVTHAQLADGIRTVEWPARMQQLSGGALNGLLGAEHEIWLDGGHNPSAAVVTAQTMAELEEASSKPLVLIIGMMKNKDAAAYLEQFSGLAREIIAVPVPDTSEGHEPASLLETILDLGFTGDMADNVAEAVTIVALEQDEPVRVLICGSLYLAGHVLDLHAAATPAA